MKHFKYISLLISVVLFVAAMLIDEIGEKERANLQQIASNASKGFSGQERNCINFLDKFTQLISAEGNTDSASIYHFARTNPVEWFSVFVFQKDSLLWWSDNTVLPSAKDLRPGFKFYHNGWYKFYVKQSGDYTVAGLLRIKNQYAFQNKFLSGDFHKNLNIPSSILVAGPQEKESVAVKDSNGTPVFYIKFEPAAASPGSSPLIAVLYIISYLFFLITVYRFLIGAGVSNVPAGLCTLVVIALTRFLSVYYNFPSALYELQLFSPSYYASSFLLNSLGDLLITSVLLTYLVSVFYRTVSFKLGNLTTDAGEIKSAAITSSVLLFTILFSVFVNHLIAGLIINSRISFNINNVFDLDFYSLVGVVIIGFLLFAFYLVCDGAARFMQKANADIKHIAASFLISLTIFSAAFYLFSTKLFFSDYGITTLFLTLGLVVYVVIIRTGLKRLNDFTRYLLVILGFSIFAAQTISGFNDLREKENRKLLAAKLENEQDQIAEYLFDDVAASVARDKVITGFFANSYEKLLTSVDSTNIIDKRLTQVYFTGYWGKYDINIKCFNNEGLPINTGGDPTWNLDHLNIKVREEGRETFSPYLFFTGNSSGRISYVGRIPVFNPNLPAVQTGTIVINLVSKLLQDEAGFPELLISDKIPQKRDISNYSYAHYRNGILVNQSGDYNYLISSDPYASYCASNEHEHFVNFDNFSHLFYNTGQNGLLVVSTRQPGVLEFITLFSYLFSFYAVCFLLIYVSGTLWKNNGRISVNFKNRIQATVVVIVVATMLLIGGATVYYIFKNYVTNLGLNVNERLKSMLIAIQDELSTRSPGDQEITDEMNYTFSKLAATLAIDLNIYSSEGMLVYSTQPKIYDQSLIARTMNRDALFNLVKNNKSLFIQYEEIGTLQFLSAYEPVRNKNNQTTGYINLPYFARQDELKKDISSFLVALINIYVLLFAFAVFITFIISNRITKPLQLIQQRLGRIKLGKRNELIEWDHDDEIGALVKEYNRMVEELADSAELLARSERESAWREMARQVAHEIKNPLTPMKLGVQHLQRAWKEKSPDIDHIMERFTQILVEQIDTLSNIATEFSNFAKMPRTNNEAVDIVTIIKNTVALYSENESATLTWYEHKGGDFIVYADKEQLLRVFSNLIKNALQSINEGSAGHVHLEIKKQNDHVIVSVKDNGAGIPVEEQSKIFTPNFTTKTGGMGLGLAMVKNIIEQSGGKVWFTSQPGEGTVFYVSLPVFENPDTSNPT